VERIALTELELPACGAAQSSRGREHLERLVHVELERRVRRLVG
jgi:hypothetical protein